MYTKEQYKERFRGFDTDELIRNALRELTAEAQQATREVLAERGLEGHALERKVSDVKRASFQQTSVTNECDFCGRSTVGTRVVDGSQKFCSTQCRKECRLVARSVDFPADLICDHAVKMRHGQCPVCEKTGGIVEMRPSWRVFSVIFFSYKSKQHELCCRDCGRRTNLSSMFVSALIGWWSPRGLFWTPEVIWRNIASIRAKDLDVPSALLLYKARLDLAERIPAEVEQILAQSAAFS